MGSEDLGILEYQIRSLECLKSRAAVPVATTIARVLIHTDDYQTRLQASYPSSLVCLCFTFCLIYALALHFLSADLSLSLSLSLSLLGVCDLALTSYVQRNL